MVKLDNTLIRVYIKNSSYISGIGPSETWDLFSFPVDSQGRQNSNIWCNWQSLFGNELRDMELRGIKQPAKIQCPYIPTLYAALQTKEALVYKWIEPPAFRDGVPDVSQPGWYKVTSGVEDVHEEHRRIEFNVCRYELK